MDKTQIHELLPRERPEFFCIAPFQSTRQNAYGRTSPCAFGAGEWKLGDLTPEQRWNSQPLNQLRLDFVNGKKPSECQRCWNEELAGKKSLRQRQLEYFPDDYEKFVLSGDWINGPKTAVFKTSNVCNLACRSCAGWDSNTYTKEGQFYADTYNTQYVSVDGNVKVHNRFIPLLPPKHTDFMQFCGFANNLEKIDFFGGEPFLNITQLDLLEYLVDKKLSKNITLFYSTNCTQIPTDRLQRAWNYFKRVEISVSIDGIENQFEYLRWPGKWERCLETLGFLKNLSGKLDCEIFLMSGLTFSIYNMLQADSITAWLQNEVGKDVYVNMVNSPQYLSLHIVPDQLKLLVREKVKHPEVLGYIDISPHDPLLWKQFLIWTKRQDSYRNQDFATTFPELYQTIAEQWDALTDLTENNFHSI